MQEGKNPLRVRARLAKELRFKFVKPAVFVEAKHPSRNREKVNDKSEIWKKKVGDKVVYVRIDAEGNDGPSTNAGARKPHYHVDTCDTKEPARNPVRDASGKPQKNPDGTWQTTLKTEDPNGTVTDPKTGKTYQSQDKHFEEEWEPGAVNNDKEGNPVSPADGDWAPRTHLHDPSWAP